MTVQCVYCNQQIDPESSFNYRRIIGWERKAVSTSSRRGGSDVALRERQNEFACGHCIAKLKRGVSSSQGALL